ncbi:hypothetical protein C6H66_18340 [Photorhabdus hindustanensis]|uniref:Uncharacterized protein n=1 Tax=Photorhabdus hindustanensis TaxID=2918802 RepID=A0A2S8PXF1_9GAMM|nr:hypothetical protein C6H66_18340 [Photorhabdus hindustanensis]
MPIMALISRNKRRLMQKTAQKKYCLQSYSNSRQALLSSVFCLLSSVFCLLSSVFCPLFLCPLSNELIKGFKI